MSEDDVIARLYEAAAIPELWPALLDAIARQMGAMGGMIFHQSAQGMRTVHSDGIAAILEQWVARGFHRDPSRSAPLLQREHPGFLTDLDVFTAEERRTLPCYAEFLTPNGWDLGAGTVVPGAHDDRLMVTLEAYGNQQALRDSIPFLDALRPHLARAVVLSAQLRLRENQAAVEALEQVGSPAAILGHRGQIVTANAGFQRQLGAEFHDGRDRLRFAHRGADAALTEALERVIAEGRGASIAIRDALGVGVAAMHLVPLRRGAQDLFANAAAIALVARPHARAAADVALVQTLFDLTPAEATVARAIAAGVSVERIARQSGKAVETVRSHLKRVYSKTATGRQTELAILLQGFAPPVG